MEGLDRIVFQPLKFGHMHQMGLGTQNQPLFQNQISGTTPLAMITTQANG